MTNKWTEAIGIARKAGCFVVDKSYGENKLYLVYREAPFKEKNIFLGKRKNLDGLLRFVKKVCVTI